MAEKIAELRKDITELDALAATATRQKVKDILSIETRKLATELITLEEKYNNSFQPAATPSGACVKRYQIKLNNYAWDQSSKFVKFYVTLQKVQSLPADNIFCTFTGKSLELNVKDLDNKDYIFIINNLLYNVNPEQSTWKVKSDMVIVSVAKVEQINWSHVTELEKKSSDAKKMPSPGMDKLDPTAGIMNIMKDMYDKGDDEMKRTIAKTWTESQMKRDQL